MRVDVEWTVTQIARFGRVSIWCSLAAKPTERWSVSVNGTGTWFGTTLAEALMRAVGELPMGTLSQDGA